MKQHYKHMFDQVLNQVGMTPDQVEQQRLALASRCAPPKSEVSSMKRSKKSIRILLTAAAVAVILTVGALAASGILSRTTYLTGGQMTVRDGNDGYHEPDRLIAYRQAHGFSEVNAVSEMVQPAD